VEHHEKTPDIVCPGRAGRGRRGHGDRRPCGALREPQPGTVVPDPGFRLAQPVMCVAVAERVPFLHSDELAEPDDAEWGIAVADVPDPDDVPELLIVSDHGAGVLAVAELRVQQVRVRFGFRLGFRARQPGAAEERQPGLHGL